MDSNRHGSAINPFQESNLLHPTSKAIRRFTKLTCFSTLALIFIGGMVTSTNSGLSVPDWPTSYGSFFPPMVGGVFYEHGHRMVASLIGLFMLCQAIWIAKQEQRKWVKKLNYFALGAVIAQGLLGGITVLLFLPDAISVMHGVLAQTFFVLTIIIAYSVSLERKDREKLKSVQTSSEHLKSAFLFAVLIYIQLILGAIMRHSQSGLAIPDFPTMGGEWLPTFDNKMLNHINSWRFDNNLPNVTMTQVFLHFLHRTWAFLIFIALMLLDFSALKSLGKNLTADKTLFALNFLVFIQLLVGIMTVLTQKDPIVTSLHVAIGAATLGLAVLLILRLSPLEFSQFKKIFIK